MARMTIEFGSGATSGVLAVARQRRRMGAGPHDHQPRRAGQGHLRRFGRPAPAHRRGDRRRRASKESPRRPSLTSEKAGRARRKPPSPSCRSQPVRPGQWRAPADSQSPECHRGVDGDDHIEILDHALGDGRAHRARQRGRLRAGGVGAVGEVHRSRERGQVGRRLRPVTGDHRGPDVHAAGGDRQQHRHHRDRHQAGGAALSADQVRPRRPPPLRW